MAQMMRYRISGTRIRRALLEGMEAGEEGVLYLTGSGVHCVFFQALDHHGLCRHFGQFHMNWQLPEDSLCTVYALARDSKMIQIADEKQNLDEYLHNPKISSEEKKKCFRQQGALMSVNTRDILLYGQAGRYLWLLIEVVLDRAIAAQMDGKNPENSRFRIFDLQVLNPGDHFMQTFPEIYQVTGSFFHRYLSIFSTIYRQVQSYIDHLEELLDLDTAPQELLPMYGEWLGIDCGGGFLSTESLRALLKEADCLNRSRGSRRALVRLVELLTGETPFIVERFMLERDLPNQYTDNSDRQSLNRKDRETVIYDRLFGHNEMDVSVLIHTKLKETEKMQLEFLMAQFKPARCRLHVIVLAQAAILDTHCYLDHNAQITTADLAMLDGDDSLDCGCCCY